MVIILNISRFLNAKAQRRKVTFPLRLCIFAFSFFYLSSPLSSQNWSWITVLSGNGEMDAASLAIDSREHTYLSGTFTNSFSFQNADYQSFGLADNYLMKLDNVGEINWIITGGSEGNDTDGGICTDSDNALYWVGGFWLNGQYGDLEFTSTKSSKSLFFIKYNEAGEVVWTKLIEGSNAKNSSSPITDQEKNIYLTGSFSDTLFIDNQLLIAQAREDIFIGKWDQNGQLLWLKNYGIDGLNRATQIAITQTNDVIIGGSFKGTIAINKDTITANTPDFDVFIAALDKNGTPKWLQKAGGVLEDNLNSLALDQEDNCYVVGQYTGRLTLSEDIEITTEGFNENGFLLKYDLAGTPLWAKSIGGTNFETATAILADEELTISGYFEKELSIDDLTIKAAGSLNGFIWTSDKEGATINLASISSDNLLLISQLSTNSFGNTVVGGVFKGMVNFDNTSYSSTNHFAIFLGALNERSTNIPFETNHSLLKIYPNPSTNRVKIETTLSDYSVHLWNMNGQQVYEADSPSFIPVIKLATGTYLLEIRIDSGYRHIEKLVISR